MRVAIWAIDAVATQLIRLYTSILHLFGMTYQGRVQRQAILGGVLLTAVFSGLVVWLTWGNGLLSWQGQARWDKFRFADYRANAVALYDSEDRYFGIIHPETENDHLGDVSGDRLKPFGLEPDHKAVPVADAPEYFWRCVLYTEDRNRGNWHNAYGVDAFSLLKMPLTRRGGSTIEMQIARSMWKMHSGNSKPIPRKWKEWHAAAILNQNLIKNGDDRDLRIWFSKHVPLIRGAGGEQGSIYGVYAASQFLFGKKPDEIDPAEQLILAAAVRQPIRWSAKPEQRARELFRLIGDPESLQRATLCASDRAKMADGSTVIPTPLVREQTVARLLEIRSDINNLVKVDPAFEDALRDRIESPRGPLLAPEDTAKRLAPNVQREVVAELTDRFALLDASETEKADIPLAENGARHPWRSRIHEVKLTLDVATNHAFRAKAREAIFDFSEDYSTSADFRDGAFPKRTIREDGTGRIITEIDSGDTPILMVAADEDGRIVRYYNSFQDTIYSGTGGQRPNIKGYGNGPYNPARNRRQIGSVGKIGAALVLAHDGDNSSGAVVSNACLGAFQYRCWRSGRNTIPTRVSLKRAFGESLNSPIIRKMTDRGIGEKEILDLMQPLGFRLPNIQDSGTPATTSLALGRFNGRPKAVHWMASLLLASIKNSGDDIVEPYFVDKISIFEPGEAGALETVEKTLPVPRVRRTKMVNTEYPGYLKNLLSEPICNTRSGSLRRLKAWCATSRSDVALHVAKTGTVSAAGASGTSYDESDWWIAGAIEFEDGRAYSYVVSIGSGSPRQAFARDLGGGHASPILNALLTDLAEG